MSKYKNSTTYSLMVLSLALLVSLFLFAACGTDAGSKAQALPTTENTTVTDVDIIPTPSPSAISAAESNVVNQLITSLTAAGATVVNNGRTEQGLFPGEGIDLWHLTVNDTIVNVYEFGETAAREAVSNNISPRGDEYTVTEGDTTATITWDGEGVPHFWALDYLIINYWGEDAAIIGLLNNALGFPFASGFHLVLPRPEAGSGEIAGVSEYGISFQYDPYLAAILKGEVVDAFTDDDGMSYMLLPQHLAFSFANSYVSDDPLLQRQQLNLETMPRIVVYPAAAYAAMHPLAGTQIEQLQALLEARPTAPGGSLPYLPLQNAAQVFHSQLAYLTFANGAGVRYVTVFAQGVNPITNQEIIYTFQGLTDDGQFYVAAFFPVTTAVLPDTVQVEDWDAFHANYDTYISETTADLDQLPPTAFTPELTLLDALVTSLRIEPGTLATDDLAYRLPIFVEQLPSVAPLELNIDPAAGLITYQKDRQLWLSQADLSGDSFTLAECAERDKVICDLPRITWSPDGSHFFYQVTVNGEHRLLISDLQGQQQGFRLSHLPSRDPVWSPDGNKIVLFIVDSNRPWGDHSSLDFSALNFGFMEEVWQLQMEPSGIWLAPTKVTDLETAGIGCGGGGGSTSDALYDIQGGFALGHQAAREMVWTNDDAIIYPLTCDYWQGYGRLDTQTGHPLAPYSGLLRGLTLDSSGSRWFAVTGFNRNDDPANNRLVTGTADRTEYEVIETAVPVEMVFVGLESGRLYYTSRELLEHKDLSKQIKWDKSVAPYFNFYHTQLWTILPDGSDERLLWESDDHSFSRVTETMEGDVLFVLIENDVELYETIAGGTPEEEWIAHLPHTHIMHLSLKSNEPEICLEDAHSLAAWYPRELTTK